MAGQSSYSRLAGDDEAAMISGSDDYDSKKLRLLGYEPQLKRNLSYVLPIRSPLVEKSIPSCSGPLSSFLRRSILPIYQLTNLIQFSFV